MFDKIDMVDSFTLKTAVSLVAIYFFIATFQWIVKERKIHALGGRAHKIQSYLPFGSFCPVAAVFSEMIHSNRY